MGRFDATKFVFSETFTNDNGKTSGSGFIGVILGLVAAITFIAAMIGYFFQIPNTVEVMEQMLKLVASSTILLGVRNAAGQYVQAKKLQANAEIEAEDTKKG